MACVTSQLIEEVTAHAQIDSLEDAREICADGTYFPNNQRTPKPTVHKRLYKELWSYTFFYIQLVLINYYI